jgi:hypothetical protein
MMSLSALGRAGANEERSSKTARGDVSKGSSGSSKKRRGNGNVPEEL